MGSQRVRHGLATEHAHMHIYIGWPESSFGCFHLSLWKIPNKLSGQPNICYVYVLVNPKGNQSWMFIERTDAEAETPILWPPDGKNWLIGKDPDGRKDWRWEVKGTTEDKMAGWYHWRESEWTPVVGDGQGGLACCDSWGRKESDTTEWLIWSDGYAT